MEIYMCINSLDFSKLELIHYTYNKEEKKLILKNKSVSTHYISMEQIKIYDYLRENNYDLFIDSSNTINIKQEN